MISEVTKKWIEAAKILGADPTATIRCPERDDDVLRVHDEVTSEPSVKERYLTCPTCGARNIMRLNMNIHVDRRS